jgi:hypothetical protein
MFWWHNRWQSFDIQPRSMTTLGTNSGYSTISNMICFGGTIDGSLLMQQTNKMGDDVGALEKDFQER